MKRSLYEKETYLFVYPVIFLHSGNPMNQTVYILILISLVILFLFNKYEREKLQRLLQEQLLKDQAFKDSIKEKIQETANINDVIHAINKDYRLGLLLAKEVIEKLK